MKSDAARSFLTNLRARLARWLFHHWLLSFKDPKERADKFSELIRGLAIDARHETESNLNATSANELMLVRYPNELAKIKESVAALSAAAWDENPYLYTECTKTALAIVFFGMRRARAALLAWMEENPSLDYHNHSSGLVAFSCMCDDCQKKRQAILGELHEEAGKNITRMNAEFQFKFENLQMDPERRTLQ